MKEDRKPLMYITRGIVAMNLCWRKRRRIFGKKTFDVKHEVNVIYREIYLGQVQGVDEIHGDVCLGQIDYQPGGHVQ